MGKKLFCIIGPSGSGKSTYVSYARQETGYGEIISTTTRIPRIGEVNGKDYHFVTREEFEKIPMIEVDEYSGNLYGTAQKDLDHAYAKSQCAFMVITYEGAESFKKLFKELNLDIEVITVFVYTPIEELEKRMIHRGDHLEKVKERIQNIKNRKEYENKNKVDYIFEANVNQTIEDVCQAFVKLIKSI
ncbi:MAG: hypothetical protein K2P09_00740 [Erysipelotrichales bacterium]|nr:hypothetical protein [Erysipelotrichales bacterium]